MGRGDQVGGVRRSLGMSESLLRQSLLEIDTATFGRMVSRGLLHGKTFLSRPLTVRRYLKFSVTQFDNVLCPAIIASQPGKQQSTPRFFWIKLRSGVECNAMGLGSSSWFSQDDLQKGWTGIENDCNPITHPFQWILGKSPRQG